LLKRTCEMGSGLLSRDPAAQAIGRLVKKKKKNRLELGARGVIQHPEENQTQAQTGRGVVEGSTTSKKTEKREILEFTFKRKPIDGGLGELAEQKK